jgi:hypothetical protein
LRCGAKANGSESSGNDSSHGDGGVLSGLTFEVRRDRRQDARPGLVKMYAYHQPGPGGLPLGLASTEGLGIAGRGVAEDVLTFLNTGFQPRLLEVSEVRRFVNLTMPKAAKRTLEVAIEIGAARKTVIFVPASLTDRSIASLCA